jgi:heat shock protein HslJ
MNRRSVSLAEPRGEGNATRRLTRSRASGAGLGRYEQDGDRIRFSALATTRMACLDEEANRQEGAFVESLGQVDRFMVSGDALTLFQGERPRARFAAVYHR